MTKEKKWRIVRRRVVRAPDRWGVQRLDGYTDGKPSWKLATLHHFWSRESAQAFMDTESAKAKAMA